MTGFEAISHYKGWAQAIAGVLIVMSGLGVLSFAISQLHKVAAFIERRNKKPETEIVLVPAVEAIMEPPPDNLSETIDTYRALIDRLDDTFQIGELYNVCKERGFTHPYLSIKILMEAGVLRPLGDGVFTWRP